VTFNDKLVIVCDPSQLAADSTAPGMQRRIGIYMAADFDTVAIMEQNVQNYTS